MYVCGKKNHVWSLKTAKIHVMPLTAKGLHVAPSMSLSVNSCMETLACKTVPRKYVPSLLTYTLSINPRPGCVAVLQSRNIKGETLSHSMETNCVISVVLKEHADDGHHRQSSVSKFGRELLGFLSRVRSSQHLKSKVACGSRSSRRLVLGNLAEGHVCQDLAPSSKVSMLGQTKSRKSAKQHVSLC